MDKVEFAHLPINEDFGISDSDLNSDYLSYPHNVVAQYYGLTSSDVMDLIQTCKNYGVSPVFFLAKSLSEGGGAGGFVNQYATDTGQGWRADLVRDLNWMVATANNAGYITLAWDDPGGGTVGMVPQSVRNYGNGDAQSMPVGSIGRLLLQGTASAVWGMYYPQGLLKAYNGVQDYADGIGQILDIISGWGGSPNGSSGGGQPVKKELIQVAKWPFGGQTMQITQGQYDIYSHMDEPAVDIQTPADVNTPNSTQVFAPFDGTVYHVIGGEKWGMLVILSKYRVHWADDSRSFGCVTFIHGNYNFDISPNGREVKRDELIGGSGTLVGLPSHVHMTCAKLSTNANFDPTGSVFGPASGYHTFAHKGSGEKGNVTEIIKNSNYYAWKDIHESVQWSMISCSNAFSLTQAQYDNLHNTGLSTTTQQADFKVTNFQDENVTINGEDPHKKLLRMLALTNIWPNPLTNNTGVI